MSTRASIDITNQESTWPARPSLGVLISAPTYTATYPDECAGLDVVITNNDGDIIDTVTLTEDLPVVHSYVPEDNSELQVYVGTVTPEDEEPVRRAYDLALDTPGASETAYFIATGPVYATDGNGAEGNLVFEADDRHGDLPTWASIASGDIALSDEAGTCAFAIAAEFDMDFTGASAVSDAPGTISDGGCVVKVDGGTILNKQGISTDGDGENLQTTATTRGGNTVVGSLVTAILFPYATDDQSASIPDGEATPRVAFTITRLAPAPVLPTP